MLAKRARHVPGGAVRNPPKPQAISPDLYSNFPLAPPGSFRLLHVRRLRASPVKPKSKNLILAAGVLLILAASAFYGRFTSLFVCRECGAVGRETEWQVPFTSLAVFRDTAVEATPLSLTLQSLHRVPADHTHNWWLIHGSGNGIMCALGSGHGTFQAARSEDISQLIRTAHAAGQTDFADQLIRCAFQRDTAQGLWMMARRASLDGFPDSSTFDSWPTSTPS